MEIKSKRNLYKRKLKACFKCYSKINNRGENVDDLFQVGCIGLMKAIDNFDLEQNVKFSTYAVNDNY